MYIKALTWRTRRQHQRRRRPGGSAAAEHASRSRSPLRTKNNSLSFYYILYMIYTHTCIGRTSPRAHLCIHIGDIIYTYTYNDNRLSLSLFLSMLHSRKVRPARGGPCVYIYIYRCGSRSGNTPRYTLLSLSLTAPLPCFLFFFFFFSFAESVSRRCPSLIAAAEL